MNDSRLTAAQMRALAVLVILLLGCVAAALWHAGTGAAPEPVPLADSVSVARFQGLPTPQPDTTRQSAPKPAKPRATKRRAAKPKAAKPRTPAAPPRDITSENLSTLE